MAQTIYDNQITDFMNIVEKGQAVRAEGLGAKVTFESYQLEAQETAIYSGSLDVMYPALGLAGEVGETLNKIKKHYRDGTPLDKDDMTKELGDVLWYLSALATDLDIDLEEVAMENLKKLKDRQDRGVIGGSGDYR
jgi:NTP pyrophosphatase (non-canonical NTP hydrolase)